MNATAAEERIKAKSIQSEGIKRYVYQKGK
jgi:hypothetical protein